MTNLPFPNPSRPRRWFTFGLYSAAAVLAAFAIFRFGALSTLRAFALAQPSGSVRNPFEAHYLRYVVAVLWPLPAAAFLIITALAFSRGRSWRWVPLILAVLWITAYVVIKPPTTYYYWLSPVQPK